MNFILKGGEEYELPEVDLQLLIREYPRVNVKEELLKASAWCRMTPAKRKTRRGIGRFITNWLSRAQDRVPHEKKTHAQSHKPFEPEPEKVMTEEGGKRGLAMLRGAMKTKTPDLAKGG